MRRAAADAGKTDELQRQYRKNARYQVQYDAADQRKQQRLPPGDIAGTVSRRECCGRCRMQRHRLVAAFRSLKDEDTVQRFRDRRGGGAGALQQQLEAIAASLQFWFRGSIDDVRSEREERRVRLFGVWKSRYGYHQPQL